MSTLRERALSVEERIEFEIFGQKGLNLLRQDADANPAVLVDAVDSYTHLDQKNNRSFVARMFLRKSKNIERALGLGIVWGNQLVRRFGWEWVCVVDQGDDRYGVVSQDRSLVVYPTYFIKTCLDHPHVDCTAMLVFNMIAANNIPEQPSGSYRNVMEGVCRIVPR